MDNGRKKISDEKKHLIFIRHLIQKCSWNIEEFGYCPVCESEEREQFYLKDRERGRDIDSAN